MDSPLNEKGFALVFLLTLLPTFLALAFGLGGLSYILYAQRILQHTCRTELWQAQKQFADHLNALLRLNPRAESLSREYHQALTTADTPPGAARLAALLVRIALFNMKQKAYVLALRKEPHHTLQAISRHLRLRLQRYLNTVPSLSITFIKPWVGPVRTRPLDELLSTYHAAPYLERQQHAQVNWRLDISHLLANLLPFAARLLAPHSTMSGACAASIYQENTQWSSSLVQVK